mmetsp:Transcript_6703/g.28673  ORF Transcript_6703/g.28673 Transcript_6703/m.28673 type:complete len:92 (-) Transcript_6703:4007-4282(-)
MDRSAGFVGSGQLLRSGRASGKGTAVCMSAERPAAASRRDVLLGIAGTIGVALGSSQPTLAAEVRIIVPKFMYIPNASSNCPKMRLVADLF